MRLRDKRPWRFSFSGAPSCISRRQNVTSGVHYGVTIHRFVIRQLPEGLVFCFVYFTLTSPGCAPFPSPEAYRELRHFELLKWVPFFSIRFVALCVRRDKEGRDLKPIFTALVGRHTSFHRPFMYTTLRIAKAKQNKKTTLFHVATEGHRCIASHFSK